MHCPIEKRYNVNCTGDSMLKVIFLVTALTTFEDDKVYAGSDNNQKTVQAW